MRLASLLAVSVCASACPEAPEPVFDDNIGVEAIPIEAGEAEGTFALKVVNTTLVEVPVLGDFQGGGVNYRLVHRTYDAEKDVYNQSSVLCGGFNFEVSGVTTSLPESTYRAVAESTEEKVTIDAGGKYDQSGHLQLWGLRDLPEPFDTALPTSKEEAAESPWDERIFDMDDDDNDGVTTVVSGAVSGEVYVIQRKTVTTSGVVLGPDEALGLAKNTNEVLQLGNNNPLLDRQSEGNSGPHPNPKLSWFHEARIDDDDDCDVVMSAEEDGLLAVTPPFDTTAEEVSE